MNHEKKLCCVHGDGPVDLENDAECDACADTVRDACPPTMRCDELPGVPHVSRSGL